MAQAVTQPKCVLYLKRAKNGSCLEYHRSTVLDKERTVVFRTADCRFVPVADV